MFSLEPSTVNDVVLLLPCEVAQVADFETGKRIKRR
jgi:hypothetical protein